MNASGNNENTRTSAGWRSGSVFRHRWIKVNYMLFYAGAAAFKSVLQDMGIDVEHHVCVSGLRKRRHGGVQPPCHESNELHSAHAVTWALMCRAR